MPVPDLKLVDDSSTNISGITDQEKVAQTGHMMVFNGCENPEIFLEFLDYFYTDAGNLLANWGVEGRTFVYDDSGKPIPMRCGRIRTASSSCSAAQNTACTGHPVTLT